MPASRRVEKQRRRREEILRSAAAAFRRKGYHGTSMDDISRDLLMTKGSLYYYFRSKEEILYACHDRALRSVLGNLADIEARKLRPDAALHALIASHVEVMVNDLMASDMAIVVGALTPPLLRKVIAKRDRYEQGLRRVIERGIDEGIFIPCDPRLVAFAIFGTINWVSKWYSPDGDLTAKQIGDAFGDYLVRGLVTEGRAAAPTPGRGAALGRAGAPRRRPVGAPAP